MLKPPSTSLALIGRGALLGAVVGVALAAVYATLAPVVVGATLAVTNSTNGRLFDALIGAAVLGICAGPFAIVLGILPAMVLGLLSGIVIALLVVPFRHRLSHRGAALIGLLVALVLVVAGNLLWGPGMIEPNRPEPGRYLPYLFWFAGPSLLILVGLPVIGWLLQQDLGRWLGGRRKSPRENN